MADKPTPYPNHPTHRLPRAQLAPIGPAPVVEPPPETRPALAEARALAREAEDDIPTMTRCPLCAGCGLVTFEVKATFDDLTTNARERA